MHQRPHCDEAIVKSESLIDADPSLAHMGEKENALVHCFLTQQNNLTPLQGLFIQGGTVRVEDAAPKIQLQLPLLPSYPAPCPALPCEGTPHPQPRYHSFDSPTPQQDSIQPTQMNQDHFPTLCPQCACGFKGLGRGHQGQRKAGVVVKWLST